MNLKQGQLEFADPLSKAPAKQPAHTINAELRAGADGRQSIVARATQADQIPITVFVPLVVTGTNGSQSVKLFLVSGAVTEATIALDQPASKVEVDDFKLNLVKYTVPKK